MRVRQLILKFFYQTYITPCFLRFWCVTSHPASFFPSPLVEGATHVGISQVFCVFPSPLVGGATHVDIFVVQRFFPSPLAGGATHVEIPVAQ